jgi:hypothetical protein
MKCSCLAIFQAASGLPLTGNAACPCAVLWWLLWYCDRFFDEYLGFPISVIPSLLSTQISLIYHRRYIIRAVESVFK